jgi:hypothetical protein
VLLISFIADDHAGHCPQHVACFVYLAQESHILALHCELGAWLSDSHQLPPNVCHMLSCTAHMIMLFNHMNLCLPVDMFPVMCADIPLLTLSQLVAKALQLLSRKLGCVLPVNALCWQKIWHGAIFTIGMHGPSCDSLSQYQLCVCVLASR